MPSPMQFSSRSVVFWRVVRPLLVAPATAQTTAPSAAPSTIRIEAVLPGVAVTLRNVDTGADADGGHRAPKAATWLPALPPGAYELRAELAGFKPHVRRGIELTVAQTLVAQPHAARSAASAIEVDGHRRQRRS